MNIFNAVLFIVSHSGTFKWKTRNVVKAVYEERFVVLNKHRAILDRCEKRNAAEHAAADADDVTTKEEELY